MSRYCLLFPHMGLSLEECGVYVDLHAEKRTDRSLSSPFFLVGEGGFEPLGTPVHEYGEAPRASMRRSGKARDRGVLAEYVAGSGTQQEWMQRCSNASVFVNRGTMAEPTDLQSAKYACSWLMTVFLSCFELHKTCYFNILRLLSVVLGFPHLRSAILTIC
jgi:hypothetical protein